MSNYNLFLDVSHEMFRRAVKDSADYAEQNMQEALILGLHDPGANKVRMHALNNINFDGYVVEFGVWQGEAINFIAKNLQNKTIYGFDSFYGLQEDWLGWDLTKNHFNLNGELPKVESNVVLIPGYFNESLPLWLEKHKDFFSLLVIDCDLYSSTKDIFDNIPINQFKEGTLILFDEYFGFVNWRNHEFKAWQEFVKKYDIEYKYLAYSGFKVLIKITKINKK